MTVFQQRPFVRLMLGASAIAVGLSAQSAHAQSVSPKDNSAKTAASSEQPADSATTPIVITGIRASLRDSMNLKRDAQGVIDAISAEDIGKFPDTNLAEALQRITGVSIDRSLGEGSSVTVRGFGPAFNLVLLDGRQMPTSNIGDGTNPPSSRSFDFANLAAEGVAAVEVYKSGRASLPTGGIGSTINIITPKPLDRPGLHGSLGVKFTKDHTFDNTVIKPNVSGIISDTFADNRIGILVTGAYQTRRASFANFTAGWREGYPGSDSTDWGSLPTPLDANGNCNDWRGCNVVNHPGANQIYQTPQNTAYNFTNISSERINGQAVLEVKPTDTLTATVDYTFSQYTVDSQTNSIGIWYNHNQTQSSWTTQGVAVGPNYYAESFGQSENKDLAITGAVAANRNINRSIGGNLKWDGLDHLHLTLDAHHSTATSKPTSPYGSNIAIGSAIYGVQQQRTDFTTAMPVISVQMYPGSEITAANIRPAGNAMRNAYMRDQIDEVSLKGEYEFDTSFIESLDFGVGYTDNKVRSAYGYLQNDTWGGTLSAADTPDNLFTATPLPPALAGMAGSNDPAILQTYFQVDTVGEINLLRSQLGICANAATGKAFPGTCLAQYTVDRTVHEKTFAPYIQTTHKFDLFGNPAHLRLGLRYERTKIDSTALVPTPTGTVWVGANEISIIYNNGENTGLTGEYDNWLPAIDFDVRPLSNVVLRAAYSHTITRPNYADMQGGVTLNAPLRPTGGGTGGSGNPGLLPYLSKNIDLSAEWYFGPSSYISVGYFHKTVSNFIGQQTVTQTEYGLTNPSQGAAAQAAIAALGSNATFADIKNYIATNYPNLIDAATGGILGQSSDPLFNFQMTTPFNSSQKAHLSGWEFALQHSFWNTGFGAILNYTIVNSDVSFNNGSPYLDSGVPGPAQFAVPGVSNSANAVLYYDKNGIQVRAAYNWRDGFLTNYGSDPFYIQPYGQLDVNASYEFMHGVSVFFEGINVTKNSQRGHERANQAVYFANPGYARYSGGVRITF